MARPIAGRFPNCRAISDLPAPRLSCQMKHASRVAWRARDDEPWAITDCGLILRPVCCRNPLATLRSLAGNYRTAAERVPTVGETAGSARREGEICVISMGLTGHSLLQKLLRGARQNSNSRQGKKPLHFDLESVPTPLTACLLA